MFTFVKLIKYIFIIQSTGEPITFKTARQYSRSGSKRRPLLKVFFKRDGGLCLICKDEGAEVPAYNIHHCLSVHSHPHWKTEPANLVSLCFSHHNKCDKGEFSLEYLFSLVK